MVRILIVMGSAVTGDRHTRTEYAANLDAAVVFAMLNEWTCEIAVKARIPAGVSYVGLRHDRIVILTDGKLVSQEPVLDLDYWIACVKRARADCP